MEIMYWCLPTKVRKRLYDSQINFTKVEIFTKLTFSDFKPSPLNISLHSMIMSFTRESGKFLAAAIRLVE